jgi:hypothetical protein
MIDEAALDRAVRRCPWVMAFARSSVCTYPLISLVVQHNSSLIMRYYREEANRGDHGRVSVLDTRQGSGV